MEVHHHPEVEKKGFKEYLLEGLMIFVAVTMGFFAEGLREHISEHDRAKEFAVTLYADLKADTADLNEYIDYFSVAARTTDTLMDMLSKKDITQIPTGKLYWYGLMGGSHRYFAAHDATFKEMESSGSMRFFGDKTIRHQLARYDQLCQVMKSNEATDATIYTEVRKTRAQIFLYQYNEAANAIWQATSRYNHKNDILQRKLLDSFFKTNPPLLAHDKTTLNQYVEMVRSRFLKDKVNKADTLRNHANALVALLKKKYDLDEE